MVIGIADDVERSQSQPFQSIVPRIPRRIQVQRTTDFHRLKSVIWMQRFPLQN